MLNAKWDMIFMRVNGKDYLVKIPPERKKDAYYYAREILGVDDNDITMWKEVLFNDKGFCRCLEE